MIVGPDCLWVTMDLLVVPKAAILDEVVEVVTEMMVLDGSGIHHARRQNFARYFTICNILASK